MKKQVQSATTLPLSPELERKQRMIKYTVAMSIRMVCIVAMLFVQGWWLLLCAIGAIFLPYFAVIIANVSVAPQRGVVERPSTLLLFDEKKQ